MNLFGYISIGFIIALGLCQWFVMDLLADLFWFVVLSLGALGFVLFWIGDNAYNGKGTGKLGEPTTGKKLMVLLGGGLAASPFCVAAIIYLAPLIPEEWTVDYLFMRTKYAYEQGQ